MAHTARARESDMTSGNLFMGILMFALPLMATGLLQTLYNAADMIVVSYSSAPDAVGAIGATSAFLNLMLNLFIGFSVGANVEAARCHGAGDGQGVSRVVHTSLLTSVIFGGGVMLIGLALDEPILRAMGNAGALLELSLTYTRIYLLGLPFLALSNYASALLRAKGDTATPLFVFSCTGLLNVGLNLLFVLGLDMTVDGVALATLLSNLCSAFWLLIRLGCDKSDFGFSFKRLRLHGKTLVAILGIGVPAGIQSCLFSLSNLFIQSSVLSLDAAAAPPDAAYRPVMKGSGASANVEAFAHAGCNATYSAAITFTGCHVGARKPERIGRVVLYSHLVTLLLTTALSLLTIALHEPLLALYHVEEVAGDPLSAIALDAARQRLFVVMLSLTLGAFMDVALGTLRGLGRSLASMLIALVGVCGLRLLWLVTVFRTLPSMRGLYLCYPVTWLLTWLIALALTVILLSRLTAQAGEE